jgi:diacylglycerol kinase family enzyme
MARTAVGSAADSPFVQVTKARSVEVKLDRKVLYELDGGDRTKVKAFNAEVEPGAVSVCVPAQPAEGFAFSGTETSVRVPEGKRGNS